MNSLKRMRPLLGTFVEICALSPQNDIGLAIEAAFDSIKQMETLLSFHDANSDLSKLNSARGYTVTVHPLSARVLRLAQAMTRKSGGLFNFTVGGTLVRKGILPDHGFNNYLDHGDANDLILHGNFARLDRPVLITLDGIAKGFAVDLAVRALKKQYAIAGWVNAGGDLRVFGELTLPVNLRTVDGSLTKLGGLRDAALASSEVRAVPNADFPGWIVGSTSTPTPAIRSVMARTAWRADALTKVACLARDDERKNLIQSLGGCLVEGEFN